MNTFTAKSNLACISYTSKGMHLAIKVKPKEKKDRVMGVEESYLVVAIAAPPIEGRVNERLIRLIGDITKTPIKQIKIVQGERSRYKKLLLPSDCQVDMIIQHNE